MEDPVACDDMQRHLKDRAIELTSAAGSLATLFEQEAIRMRRKDQVACLIALRSAILEKASRHRDREAASKMGDSMAGGVASTFRLIAGLVTMPFEDRTIQAISRTLLTEPKLKEATFGTVLVRVGPGGLPADAEVVNISELSRRSGRDERVVVDSIRAQGSLLIGEESFSEVIDTLADCIRKGKLSLPASPQALRCLQEGMSHRPVLGPNA